MEQVNQGARETVYPQAAHFFYRTLSQIAISAVTPIAAVLVALAFGAALLWLNGFNGSDVVIVMLSMMPATLSLADRFVEISFCNSLTSCLAALSGWKPVRLLTIGLGSLAASGSRSS